MSRQPITTMTHIKNEESTPCDEATTSDEAVPSVCAAGETSSSPVEALLSFPEVTANPLRVLTTVERNQKETNPEIGLIRLKALLPFALSRLGRPYEVWDKASNSLVPSTAVLTVRPFAKELSSRLACGTDFIFNLVNVICTKGPENVVAEDMLKDATSGGRGTSRLFESEERALQKAVYQVCVTDGRKPASKAANKAIRNHLIQAGGVSRRISRATIKARSLSQQILTARTDAYQRDHLHRVAGQPDEVTGLNSVVVMDTTQFTDEDSDLRVVDAQGRDLGAANVIFGILKSNRGMWSFRGFAGAANSYLTGLTIKRGLVAKDSLLKRYGIPGIWPFHGKPGSINHDNGSEFVNEHVRRVLKSRDIGYVDLSPPKTPHFRGDLERFNRTAHVLFAEFLASDCGKRYLRPVNGRPQSQGILLNDLDRAMTEWVVCHYHPRAHNGLGGDSPLSRMEKLVLGKNGLPSSGLPAPLADTEELKWDFLWEETRVVNQLGITFHHRRYINTALTKLFKPGSRSSDLKINFKFNPYAMRWVYVKVADETGREVPLKVEWLPENEKYRPRTEDQQASINPSLWEWEAIFKDICRGNTAKPTGSLAEEIFAKREAEAAAGNTKAGAPGKKTRVTEDRNRALRVLLGNGNLPSVTVGDAARDLSQPPVEIIPVAGEKSGNTGRKKKPEDPQPKLLTTGGGAGAY